MPTAGEQLERSVLDVNGLRFDALACGPASGGLVLLLHGFPEFADSWADILVAVGAAGFRAVAVDQRGYSQGARPLAVEDYATDRLVADALGFADALGAQRFHLVGHDWGGVLAWKLAVEHGVRLRSLTVLATPHIDALYKAIRSDPDQRSKSRYIGMFRLPFRIAERLLLAQNARRLRAAYRRKLPPEQLERYVARFREPGVLTAALNWYRAMNVRKRLGKVRVPTLFIWGTKDQALGRAAAETTADHMDAPYVFLPLEGASHWLLEEVPERVIGPLIEHLRRWQ
jgi:pimeloyl-ACP methyl ester carboxylesterase